MEKMILDADADGKQWIYRNMIVIYQSHPSLLSYAAYDGDKWIDHASTKKEIKVKIDQYLSKL